MPRTRIYCIAPPLYWEIVWPVSRGQPMVHAAEISHFTLSTLFTPNLPLGTGTTRRLLFPMSDLRSPANPFATSVPPSSRRLLLCIFCKHDIIVSRRVFLVDLSRGHEIRNHADLASVLERGVSGAKRDFPGKSIKKIGQW